MYTILNLNTGQIFSVDQYKLLVYCRQFDNGYVVYEEITKLTSDQILRYESFVFAKSNMNSPLN
jgi:hypothetical protein